MLIRVVKSWEWPALKCQTPGESGRWGDWCFTEDPVSECDGVLVLNRVTQDLRVRCPRDHVWALFQEPLSPGVNDWMQEGHRPFSRVFTHAPSVRDSRYVRSHPAVPWHLGRNYSALHDCLPGHKHERVVWITSATRVLPGHHRRMAFAERLRAQGGAPVEFFGRGINPIGDKWDVLYPASYALAIENARQPDYWTEKIADCFLSWSLPLYDGCPNILDYFPEDAIIPLDLDHPETAIEIIRGLPGSGEWHRRQAAIGEARRLVLEKYQFFPWMAGLLSDRMGDGQPEDLRLRRWTPSLATRLRNFPRHARRQLGRIVDGRRRDA